MSVFRPFENHHGCDPIPEGQGYIDTVLTVFDKHQHPFVVIGTLAMNWCGLKFAVGRKLDLLVKASHLQSITDELIDSGEWSLSSNYYVKYNILHNGFKNTTNVPTIWLASCREDVSGPYDLKYLQLWPEELYHLNASTCNKTEIPDVCCTHVVLLEEEYYRPPEGQNLRPARLSGFQQEECCFLQKPEYRAKRSRQDVPIYIPALEDHINALLSQWQAQQETKRRCGNDLETHLYYLWKLHHWYYPPTAKWLLENKIQQKHHDLFNSIVEKYKEMATKGKGSRPTLG